MSYNLRLFIIYCYYYYLKEAEKKISIQLTSERYIKALTSSFENQYARTYSNARFAATILFSENIFSSVFPSVKNYPKSFAIWSIILSRL